MTEAQSSPLVLRDSLNLNVLDWSLPAQQRPRAVVLIVHGLGEHAGRYQALAQPLQAWGFSVRAFDQRGHGASGGARGVLPTEDALLHDLAEVLADTRVHLCDPWGCPVLLLGHSMGGLVAATFVRRQIAPVQALVLSSPALDAGLGVAQKALVALLLRWAPTLALANGLDASRLSHSAEVVKAYQQDRLVHTRISARLARFIDVNGPLAINAAAQWSVPTLLMYAGADALVRPAGSRAFAAQAPAAVVSSHCFEDLYHEIFNELDTRAVLGTLQTWLDRQLL
jgi:alpha-beta hydrolase superfamily lysophospholipase